MAVIELSGIHRHYVLGDITVKALKGIDLGIEQGEFVAVMGPSGSGKSTLMNVLGCLDKPTSGSYVLQGRDVSDASGDEFAEIRNTRIGFVFQGFNLLARTTAIENVELPLFYSRTAPRKGQRSLAERALAEVGLEKRMHHMPSQLSGGQQQRVAIARALVPDPAYILADEPPGNLDTEMSMEIMGLFQDLNDRGKTVIMVTHEPDIASYTKRIISMRDGELVSDEPVASRRNAKDDLETWRSKHAKLAFGGMGGACA